MNKKDQESSDGSSYAESLSDYENANPPQSRSKQGESFDIVVHKCERCNAANIIPNDSKDFECWKCESNSTLEWHLMKTKRDQCHPCSDSLLGRSHDTHILHDRNNGTDSKNPGQSSPKNKEIVPMKFFLCNLCEAFPITEGNLVKHHGKHHENIQFVPSNYELLAIENSSKFIKCADCRHYVKETLFKEHKDEECGVMEISSVTFNYIKSKKHYQCQLCNRKVLEKNLERHHLYAHSHIPINQNKYQLSKAVVREKCPFCLRYFATKKKFKSHIKRNHPQTLVNDEKNETENCFEDQTAGNSKTLTDEDKIELQGTAKAHDLLQDSVDSKNVEHNATNNNQIISMKFFKCNICEAFPITEGNLVKHHEKHHEYIQFVPSYYELIAMENSSEFIKCADCQHYVRKTLLNEHKTEDCGVKEISSVTLNYVIREKYYECQVCNTFTNIFEENLKKHHSRNHKKIRIGENKYQLAKTIEKEKCPFCPKYFVKTTTFISHIERHHPHTMVNGNGIEPENCFEENNIENNSQKEFQDEGIEIKRNTIEP